MMAASSLRPYGAWDSPLDAQDLARSSVRLSDLQAAGRWVLWIESRPAEGGRSVIVARTPDGRARDLTPQAFNVRTLVHEYGGGSYVAREEGEELQLVFSNFEDQRLYRLRIDAHGDPFDEPRPISPAPAQSRALRYADGRFTPDGKHLICVRERHEGEVVINELIVLPVDGSRPPRVLASGYDFYASPRLAPTGNRLAWLCWQHPQMPWDGTELWVADLVGDADSELSLQAPQRIVGGAEESIMQPTWDAAGHLLIISDRNNWWNIYRTSEGGCVESIAPLDADIGGPQWVFGLSHYSLLDDGRVACIVTENGFHRLGMIEPDGQEIEPLDSPLTAIRYLASTADHLWAIGGSPTMASSVVGINLTTDTMEIVRASATVDLEPHSISVPEPIEFPTEGGLTAHALFYPPTNARFTAPPGELPPLLVISHGGPTGMAAVQFSPTLQYWTSRGFAVVDVNYGGSAGFGRDYRERLKGRWGTVDVQDCANAARALIERGRVDAQRVAIRGGSAGGYTTLRALTCEDLFAAGASYYGVADLRLLAQHTHKFESRYLDGLIGPWPQERDLYRERSPLFAAGRIRCPIILFQGLEDAVVPPEQAEQMAEVLAANGVPHAYVTFAGEQHGFRRAETIVHATEAELAFYGWVFSFEPADDVELPEIVHGPREK